jgi:enoyl-CoA hydratase/carnithine racemase
LRDLDDQHRARWDREQRLPDRPLHHRDVRLGPGLIVEVDGQLAADSPAGAEGFSKRGVDQLDAERVGFSLRLGDDQLAADQLEALLRSENALLDEPLVLAPAPTSRSVHSGCHARAGHYPSQCHETKTPRGPAPGQSGISFSGVARAAARREGYMSATATFKDIGVSIASHVGQIEIQRPPHNYFDNALINQIADALEAFDRDPRCRAVVLCAQGKSFCAGADFANRPSTGSADGEGSGPAKHLYKEATRIFRTRKPIVAAVQGAAIGGGLGLALAADFRVTCSEARFSANFNRLGFHPGFSLTFTLPRLVGQQKANLLFYTGRRVPGDEAVAMGLADLLVPLDQVRTAATELATEIAQSAPLAVQGTRETMRRGFADEAERATERELTEQEWTRKTADFKEGVKAWAERRLPNFEGR